MRDSPQDNPREPVESEGAYRARYERFPVPTYTWRRVGDDFVLLDHNDAAREFTKGRIADLLGAKASEMLSERPRLVEAMNRCLYERTTIEEEMRHGYLSIEEGEPEEGGRLMVSFVFVPPDLVMVHAEDVTDRKEAEAALKRSEERFRSLMQNSSDVITVISADGTIVYQTPSMKRTLAHDPKDRIGKNIFTSPLIHPDDAGRQKNLIDQTIRNPGLEPVFEVRLRHLDGSWRWVEGIISNLLDVPSVRGIVLNARDITERKEAEEMVRFQANLLDKVGQSVIATDFEGRIVYWNRAAEGMYGWSAEEAMGRMLRELVVSEDLRDRAEEMRTTLAAGSSWRGEFTVLRKDGTSFPVLGTATPVFDERGRPVGNIGVSMDITERKKAEKKLQETERYLRAVVGNVPVILFALDREGVFTLSEGKGLQALGLKPGDTVGRSAFDLYREVPGIAENVRRSLGGEEVVATVQVGEAVFEAFYGPLRDEGGEVVGAIGVAADVTERQALEGRLRHQAYHDTLTGLPNRRLFSDRLGQALRRTERRLGRTAAVLFMDLDGFKAVNDSLGHRAGDRLLVAVAERLRSLLRPEDTLARFGGDEFTVLVEDVEGPEDAVRVAHRLMGCLREPFVVDGSELLVGASTGIALGSASIAEPEELLRGADAAMYRAKKRKVLCEIFDPAKDVPAGVRHAERLGLEREIRRAIEREEFTLFYQPKFRIGQERIVEVEALLRWEHPERGLVLPAEFIPLAEESGLIVPLGRWAMGEACRQLQEWRKRYPTRPPTTACVNLSARQIRHPGLLEDVAWALRESGLEANGLTLEITESELMEFSEANEAVLKKLRALGVHFALDDFGKEYSSLSYIKRLPVEYLKVDRSFIGDLGKDAESTSVVELIVTLAHTLGMEAVAEGIETAEQLAYLDEMGCDIVQGYYLAMPGPSQDVAKLLAERQGPPSAS